MVALEIKKRLGNIAEEFPESVFFSQISIDITYSNI